MYWIWWCDHMALPATTSHNGTYFDCIVDIISLINHHLSIWGKPLEPSGYLRSLLHSCFTTFLITWSKLTFVDLPGVNVWFYIKMRGRRRQGKRCLNLKLNSRSFNINGDYSDSLIWSNVSQLSWSWIPKSLIQVQEEQENFVVARLRPP